MNFNSFRNLSSETHGNILIALGTVLLLDSLNIISINFMSLLAVALIVYGVSEAGHIGRIRSLVGQ